jgi:hypothetical protein
MRAGSTTGSVSAKSTTALMTVSQSGRSGMPCSISISPCPGPSKSRQWYPRSVIATAEAKNMSVIAAS